MQEVVQVMIELVHFPGLASGETAALIEASNGAPKIMIAIPAHNEERFIGSVVIQSLQYTPHVVVIDDGSRDATTLIAERAGAKVLRHVVNRGKSEAVNTALIWARAQGADALIFIDGDGQHRPDEIDRVMDPVLRGEADMVIGSRFLSVKSAIPAYRKVGQHFFTTVTNVASTMSVTDSQSGFRAFSRRAIAVLQFKGAGLSVESEMQFQAKEHGLVITEVPISVVYAEKAKRNPFAHGMQILSNLLKLVGQHRPLAFFGLEGFLMLLAGTYMAAVTTQIFARTHELAVGYALIAVLLLILGIMSLFVGLMLHAIRGFFTDLKRTMQPDRVFSAATPTSPDDASYAPLYDRLTHLAPLSSNEGRQN
jgi:glycosyltransferase involved in cell wall biosynthesis